MKNSDRLKVSRNLKYSQKQPIKVKEKEKEDVTYKFLKSESQNSEARTKIIYEPFIFSILEIDGFGTVLTSNGYSFEGHWASGNPIGELKIRYP